MKPQYEQYRSGRKDVKEQTSAKLPPEIKAEAELIAAVEDDSLTGLIIEGLVRVIDDRKQDPNFIANIQETLGNQVNDLENQLLAKRALLKSFQNTESE